MGRLTGEYQGRYGIKTSEGFKTALELSTESNTVKTVKEIQSAIDRLAAYENYGLSPADLNQIDKFYTEKCNEVRELKSKQLPLEVGAAVYQILIDPKDQIYMACKAEVAQIVIEKSGTTFYTEWLDEKGNAHSYEFLGNEIGDSLFLNKEKAEKKAEELNNEK